MLTLSRMMDDDRNEIKQLNEALELKKQKAQLTEQLSSEVSLTRSQIAGKFAELRLRSCLNYGGWPAIIAKALALGELPLGKDNTISVVDVVSHYYSLDYNPTYQGIYQAIRKLNTLLEQPWRGRIFVGISTGPRSC